MQQYFDVKKDNEKYFKNKKTKKRPQTAIKPLETQSNYSRKTGISQNNLLSKKSEILTQIAQSTKSRPNSTVSLTTKKSQKLEKFKLVKKML